MQPAEEKNLNVEPTTDPSTTATETAPDPDKLLEETVESSIIEGSGHRMP